MKSNDPMANARFIRIQVRTAWVLGCRMRVVRARCWALPCRAAGPSDLLVLLGPAAGHRQISMADQREAAPCCLCCCNRCSLRPVHSFPLMSRRRMS